MSLSSIFSDAVEYPLKDYRRLLVVGVVVFVSTLFNSLNPDNTMLLIVMCIFAFFFSFILSGYSLTVIKKGIDHSDEIPDFDFVNNLVDGIKVLITFIAYFIIPMIVAVIVLIFTGIVGLSIDHLGAAFVFYLVAMFILFFAFSIFWVIAIARFADTGEFGEAFNFGAIIDKAKSIGILQIIGFLIFCFVITLVVLLVVAVILFVVTLFTAAIWIIPLIVMAIMTVFVGGYLFLFNYKALGLLYADA